MVWKGEYRKISAKVIETVFFCFGLGSKKEWKGIYLWETLQRDRN